MQSVLPGSYLVETLHSLVGQHVVVQTTAKTIHQGILTNVYPEHIVVDVCRVPFIFRLDEVVFVTLA